MPEILYKSDSGADSGITTLVVMPITLT